MAEENLMSSTRIYSPESEAAVNQQIKVELEENYVSTRIYSPKSEAAVNQQIKVELEENVAENVAETSVTAPTPSNDSSTTSSTRIYSPESEAAVNQQIKAELEANYAYIQMAQYFDRSDVSLKNIAKYFRENAKEESEHAQNFIDYQQRRGGTVQLFPIQPFILPPKFDALKAFEKALELENHVYDVLLKTHDSNPNDPELQDFVASEYLHEQVKAIYEIKGHIANINRVGQGLGIYMFDKEFMKN